MNTRHTQGFTLIELLIVIGLLGALTALVLPSLSADRREAIMDINIYNKAGTARILYQYHQLTGEYPTDMHAALQGNTSATAIRMEGMPKCAKKKVSTGAGNGSNPTPATIAVLTATQAQSLADAGVASLCYGTGLNSIDLAEGTYVVQSTNWTKSGDSTESMTFDGRTGAEWATDTNSGTSDGIIVACWIAPTTNWESNGGGNSDWTNGNVDLGIDVPGQAPVPTEAVETNGEITFAYYVAHFLVDSDTDADGNVDPAELIGMTCPGGGALNP